MASSDPVIPEGMSSALKHDTTLSQRKGAPAPPEAAQPTQQDVSTDQRPHPKRRPRPQDPGHFLGPNSLLVKIHTFMIHCASIYGGFLLLVAIPFVQDQLIYMHNVRWPWNVNFRAPEEYGLELGRARNVPLTTSDNVTLGSWHVLPPSYYDSLSHSTLQDNCFPNQVYEDALTRYPTVLFLHGNAASRAVSFRVELYAQVAQAFEANVLVVDYRGFADSQGRPSELGLVLDARAAYDWILTQRARSDPQVVATKWGNQPGAGVTIMGQSLGTAVAAKLTRELTLEGSPPQGLVLAAPFASLPEVVTGFGLFGFPVFGPLELLPAGNVLLNKVVHTKWNTTEALHDTILHLPHLPQTDYPQIVITHTADDSVIPSDHSDWLLDRAILTVGADSLPNKPYESLAAVPKYGPDAKEAMAKFDAYLRAVSELKGRSTVSENVVGVAAQNGDALLETLYIPHAPFSPSNSAGKKQDDAPETTLTLVRSDHGGHEYVAPGILGVVAKLVGAKG